MTITNHKTSKKHFAFIALLAVIIAGGGILYIREYNSLVDTRHYIDTSKDTIIETDKEISDLTNDLYALTDPVKLKESADELGLILEKNPKYINIGETVEVVDL